MLKNKILLYMELPPPMHGMTYMNKIIYDSFENKSNCSIYDTNFSKDVGEVATRSINKIFRNFIIIFSAWKFFLDVKPTVVYSLLSASKFGIIRDVLINLPSILLRKKIFLHLHGFTYYKIYEASKIYKFFFDLIVRNADLIVLCEKQRDMTLNVMNKNSWILNNCLEDSKLAKKKSISINQLNICYISNISKEKGVFELIKAIAEYHDDIHLTIAGNFLEDSEIFFKVIKNTSNITYVGFADEVKKYEILSSSDIFCLPSKLEEGSPISIIEAMSYGLPVIASDKGCIKEMIENTGYLLPSNYMHSDILKGISFIVSDYDNLSEKSIKSYQCNNSKKVFIEKLESLLMGEMTNVQK